MKVPVLLCALILLAAGCAVNGADNPPSPGPAGAEERPISSAASPLPEAVAASPTPSPDVYLEIAGPVSAGAESLSARVVNQLAAPVYVVFAPRMERKTGGAWETLACNEGFCGVPDTVEDTRETDIPLTWYQGLTPGLYRLSFARVDGQSYQAIETLSAEFTLTE